MRTEPAAESTEADRRMATLEAGGLRRPATIRFGINAFHDLGALARALGGAGPVLVIAGARWTRDHEFRAFLEQQFTGPTPRTLHYAACPGEPEAPCVDGVAGLARRIRPGLVVALGGGSSLDLGKAIAALATNPGSIEDYLEGPAGARPLAEPPLPVLAAPTTAGTGSEMTRNAVIGSVRQGAKRSLRDERLIPRIALIDPALTCTAPRAVTAASGMDALTQLIECCISRRRAPEVSALAHGTLRGVPAALRRCWTCPTDLDARALMSAAASISGACLANSGLAMAHGIAAALGARHGVPHGLACGVLLPHTLRWNRDAVESELAAALAAMLEEPAPTPGVIDRGIAEIERLLADLELPPDLRYLNLTAADLDALAEASMGRSLSGNPVDLTAEDVRRFLAAVA